MNVQERDQLLQFFSALQHTPVQPRDPVAVELIRQALADGITPYDLVQRAMGLQLALKAAQGQVAELEARCAAQAVHMAQGRTGPSPCGSADMPVAAAHGPSPLAAPSMWGEGLLRQVAGTAVGVAAGVVAGGLLLEGWQRMLGDDLAAAPSGPAEGSAAAGPGLWDLGDDWT